MFMKDFTRHALAAPVSPALPGLLAAPLTGILGGTLVETAAGWREAGQLCIGTRVQTWDGGAVRILGLDRKALPEGTEALLVPGGMFDTCSDLTLLGGQQILLDTLGDPALPDAQAVLVRARALAGLPGVRRVRLSRAEAVIPYFEQDEVIWAQSGALIHCNAITALPGDPPRDGFFTCLAGSAAAAFLQRRLAA